MKKRHLLTLTLILGALYFNLSATYADAGTLRAEIAAEIAKKSNIKPYGTNPGYYDASMKANYEEAILSAQELINAVSTDEIALTNAKNTLMASIPTIILPTVGKTYYIQAPRPVGSFATATGLNGNIQCKNLISTGTDDQKNTQKWTIVSKGDGFLITNINGAYMTTDNADGSGQTNSYIKLSSTEQSNPIYFAISIDNNSVPADGSKRFYIERPSNAFRMHSGGSPTSLMNWTGSGGTGSKTDNSSWIFIEVSSKSDLETNIGLAITQLNYYTRGAGVVGSISVEEYDSFKAKIDAAQAVIDNPASTEDDFKSALATVISDTQDFAPQMVEPHTSDENSTHWYLVHNVWQQAKYMTAPASDGPILLAAKTSEKNQLWKLVTNGANQLKLVSFSGLTIAAGPTTTSGEGTWMNYEQKRPNQYAFTFEGKTPGANDEGMHCGTPEATTIVSWNNSGSSNWWRFAEATKNLSELADLIKVAEAITFGAEGNPSLFYPRITEFEAALDAARSINELSLFNEYLNSLNTLQKEYDDAINSTVVDIVETQKLIKIIIEEGFIIVNGSDQRPEIFTITGTKVNNNQRLACGMYIVKVDNITQKVIVK